LGYGAGDLNIKILASQSKNHLKNAYTYQRLRMATATEDLIISDEDLKWFEREVGGGDLPPAPESADSNDKQYIDIVALSTAFYRVIKTTAEQGLLDWEDAWSYSGRLPNLKKICDKFRAQLLTPSRRPDVFKDYINYNSFARSMLHSKIVYDNDCFYFPNRNSTQIHMVVDAHQVADDLIDCLETHFQRGARDVIRRMSMEQQINMAIRPASILSESRIKALGYQPIQNYDKKTLLFKRIFKRDVSPKINQIGKPNLTNFGIQLAPQPRRDLTP